MAKKSREDETQEAAAPRDPATRKRARTGGASTAAPGTAGMCDDALRSIFARVPARTAVASMALSKQHRCLMRCPDFRALHCRLGPPLPQPHLAYVATAKVQRSSSARGPVSAYHGFHVAGLGGSSNAPMRALAGPMNLEKWYVNTCNGVVLLAGNCKRRRIPTTCVLWNPAIADEEKEVTVPVAVRDECVILGLGYGPRSKTYKLLVSRRKMDDERHRDPPIVRKELLVYALGGAAAGDHPRLRTLLSKGLNGNISGKSLYMDGTIYLLHLDNSVILAFNVDDETVTAIDLPGEPQRRRARSGLLLMSGRPCVDVDDRDGRALWLLTAEHHWERRCVITGHHGCIEHILNIRLRRYSIAGVWDCGGMLVMFSVAHGEDDKIKDGKLLLYCTTTKKMAVVNLPLGLTPEWSDYALCWGYKPTLISPGSILGELDLDQDEEGLPDCTADIMAALKPVNERDRRIGQKATLGTVCLMELLLRIMQKLPDSMQEVIRTPLLKSKYSDYSFENELYHSYSDSASDSGSGSHNFASDSGSGSHNFVDDD